MPRGARRSPRTAEANFFQPKERFLYVFQPESLAIKYNGGISTTKRRPRETGVSWSQEKILKSFLNLWLVQSIDKIFSESLVSPIH